jgi:hypothetical protein
MHLLKRHFKGNRKFNDLQATEMLRDDYLDKYFKDTYIEWGTRWYLEKVKTRTLTNAKLLMKKLAKSGLLKQEQNQANGGGVSLIERIITKKIEDS